MDNIYTRSSQLIGEDAIIKLRNSTVLVVGIGGVGGTCFEALVRSGVKQIIDGFKDHAIDFQSMLIASCKIAMDNNDLHIFADLNDVLEDFNNIVEQTILLSDKIKMYGSNVMAFDHDISTFWILGE